MRIFLLFLTCSFLALTATAQVVILDHETPETTTNFQYFGSTLDGDITQVIANPNATGVNTSAMVGQFTKPAESQPWAGAFSNPDPSTPLDLTTATEVCVDVHMDHIGNLALKLENSTSGGDNWVITRPNTVIDEWEQLCFDVTAVSEEAPFTSAFGQVYPRAVLFFDFQTVLDAPNVYYYDNIVVNEGEMEMIDATFTVDMNVYGNTFNTAYVSGTFNEWSGDANPLSDDDLDGVWSATFQIPAGVHEYKFTLDNWTVQEQFLGTETCTQTTINDDGTFINRIMAFTENNATTDTTCFNSCAACGEEILITFEVGTSHILVDEGGLYIAGGGNFGNPGDFRMTDPDGDGVYSITFPKPIGFSSFYTFTNGNCPDYSCKENIEGLDCANPDNFNDRFFPAVMSDTVISTCYSLCIEDTDNCGELPTADVTFSVDMSEYMEDFTTVYVSGTFNEWSGESNPLSDDDMDGIWTTTLNLPIGNIEYKFTLDNWAVQEQFAEGASCTVSSGGFTNRFLAIPEEGVSTPEFCFNSCLTCGESTDVSITFNVGTSHISVDAGGLYIAGGGNFGTPGEFPLTDDDGDGVYSITITRPLGFSSFYTFANGNCPDFSCKENIAGQACSDPDNFDDRFLPAVMSDTIINTCYAICTDDTECGDPATADVTFSVDMNEYMDPFTTVYVSGTFNGFNGEANPMSDDDLDGVWTTTLNLPVGDVEYIYTIDNYTDREFFEVGDVCTVSTPDSMFTNRFLMVPAAGVSTPEYCFGECAACGQAAEVTITFNVGTSHIDVDAGGIFLAGGGNFGEPGDFPMTDDDGDGIWTITITRPVGFESFYTLANGNCPDFSCKENISGQDCANPDNFNDRFLPAVMSDTIINTCFAICTDDTECGDPLEAGLILFSVDMREYTESFTTVYVSGAFNEWSGTANPMTDDNADGIWEAAIMLSGGRTEYKFSIDDWTAQEEFAMATEGCTVQSGAFINRVVDVDGDADLMTFCFNSCDACAVSTVDLTTYGVSFNIQPTIVNDQVTVNLSQGANQHSQLQIFTVGGQLVQSFDFTGPVREQLNVSGLASGFYFVRLQHENAVGIERMIKQ